MDAMEAKLGFYTERLVILLSEAQMRELDRLSTLLGRSRSDLARDAIQALIGMINAETKSSAPMVDKGLDKGVA